MRPVALLRTAGLLAGTLLGLAQVGPAQAAPRFTAPLSQIFERVCLNNRPEFDKAIEDLEAAGYVEASTNDDAVMAIRKFETTIGETPWAVQLADRVRPDQGTAKPQRIRACTVIGVDPTGVGEAELRGWLGLPKPEAGKATVGLFVEKDGRPRLITAAPADTGPALQDGGFYTLAIVDTEAGKMAMLIFASPAP